MTTFVMPGAPGGEITYSSSQLVAWLLPWLLAFGCECWGSGYLFAEILLYLRRFWRSDPAHIRGLVCLVWLLNFVQDLQTGGIAITKFVAHFGDLVYFDSGMWLTYAQPPMTSAITLMTQIFFAARCYKCIGTRVRQRVFLAGIIPLLVASVIGGIMVGVNSATKDNTTAVTLIHSSFIAWLSLTLATDVIITTILLFFLYKQIHDTEDTQSLIDRLVILTFESMLPPALCVLGTLTVFACLPFSSIYILLIAIQGKLYSISLMHTLNARWRLRNDVQTVKQLSPPQFGTSRPFGSEKHASIQLSRGSRRHDFISQHTQPLTSIRSLDVEAFPMDDPSNWRGDQDIVDLATWRAAGFGEFLEDDEDQESKPSRIKEEDDGRPGWSASSLQLKTSETTL